MHQICWYLSVVVIFCCQIRIREFKMCLCALAWPSQMHCGITVMQMKPSLWGGSVVYQKHARQNKSVLSTHASVPGECESHSQPKGQHLCRCKRSDSSCCSCHHSEIIDSWIFIIDKRAKFKQWSHSVCVVRQNFPHTCLQHVTFLSMETKWINPRPRLSLPNKPSGRWQQRESKNELIDITCADLSS